MSFHHKFILLLVSATNYQVILRTDKPKKLLKPDKEKNILLAS